NASALSDANLVLLITYQVTFGAQDAKEAALASAQNALWFTVVATIGAMILFVLALILVWRWFKRRYSDRLSDANVEVISE
ncbi:MAG TPA: hypothetical protein VK253_04710, partial [Candidatus Binatia bacterium]|nr:hypothetical protein [Candidatus Binatia bacterium]